MQKSMTLFAEVTLKNIKRIRKILGARQEDFANVMDLNRTDYNKRENGKYPLSIDEVGRLLDHYNIGLDDIFRGFQSNYHAPPSKVLKERTRIKFPYIEQIITAANQIAGEDNTCESDVRFLRECLKYAMEKLDSFTKVAPQK